MAQFRTALANIFKTAVHHSVMIVKHTEQTCRVAQSRDCRSL